MSRPLAAVSLRPSSTASGPSRVIQELLQEPLNPGQLAWLHLLMQREALAARQLLLQDDAERWPDAGAMTHGEDGGSSSSGGQGPLVDLRQLQAAAGAGGRLEPLRMTPMQLSDMVQACSVTVDACDAAAAAALGTAAASAGAAGGSAATGAAGAAAAALVAASPAADDSEPCVGCATCGLWPELALLARSCAPNVTLTLLPAHGDRVLIRAADYLPAGAQVCSPSVVVVVCVCVGGSGVLFFCKRCFFLLLFRIPAQRF